MTRLAVDYLSPLPPVRSGVSEYSADLLPALAAELGENLRVVALDRQEITPELVARWRPVPMAEAGADDRLILAHMGNNLHHRPVWEVAQRSPGIMVLHDLVLHHFLVERTLAEGDLEGYIQALEAEHGWSGRAAGLTRRWNAYSEAAHFQFPAHRRLLRAQRGVLVHSEWAAGRLREEDPELRVRAIPMGIPAPPALDPERGADFRRRHGLPATAPLLGSFGFQTPIKRTEAVIRALADPRLASARLVVVGQEAATLDLGRVAAEAGVEDRVLRLGYAPFAELEAAMAATDLSVNLRYPSAGETSASLLRLLAVGRPVLVSDYAQFAELPDAVAVKVPLDFDHEVAALAGALAELLASRETLDAMGVAARRHVLEAHRPEQAAAAMLAACAEWRAAPPLAGAELAAPAPDPPTTRTWGAIEGSISIETPPAWAPGERGRVAIHLDNRGLARWLAAGRGSGGVMLEVRLESGGRDLLAGRPWQPLPRDLAPGEQARIELEMRRPPAEAVLVVEPHVVGVGSFAGLGGPRCERTLPGI